MRRTRWLDMIPSASLADCLAQSHELAGKVAGAYEPDCVIAVLHGGLLPAVTVAEDLGLAEGLIGIKVRRRRDVERIYRLCPAPLARVLQAGYYLFSRPVTPRDPLRVTVGRALVVDDRADTGATLQETARYLVRRCGATEVRTAVLAWLGGRPRPDFHVYKGMLKMPWSAQSAQDNPDFYAEYCAFMEERSDYLAARGIAVGAWRHGRTAGEPG